MPFEKSIKVEPWEVAVKEIPSPRLSLFSWSSFLQFFTINYRLNQILQMIAEALSAVDTSLHSCVGVVCLSHAESGHKSIRKPAVGVKNGNAPFLIYSVLACSVPDGKICV